MSLGRSGTSNGCGQEKRCATRPAFAGLEIRRNRIDPSSSIRTSKSSPGLRPSRSRTSAGRTIWPFFDSTVVTGRIILLGAPVRQGRAVEYNGSMKVKTSVTLSREALQAIDRLAGADANRSRVIERAVLELLHRQERIEREARDLAILNRAADRLNREMRDVLRDQVET